MLHAFFYLLAVNLLTFLAFYYDKRLARQGGWRVPEQTLLGLSLLGGTPAAFWAASKLRHKSKKVSFRNKLWFVVLVQGLALLLWLFPGIRNAIY